MNHIMTGLKLQYRWINLFLFKLSWLCAALLGNTGLALLSLLILMSFLLGPRSKSELTSIAILALLGISVDWLLLILGIFKFDSNHLPLWLGLLWVAFAQAIGHGFWFIVRQRLPIQALIGAGAGCVSYYAGMKLGAIVFGYPLPYTLAVLALIWSMLLPCLFYVNERLRNA